MLIGRLSAGEKTEVRRRISSGESRLVIGTHALVQERTSFERLGSW
jgi:ATP-dependent DNA helicase RecG